MNDTLLHSGLKRTRHYHQNNKIALSKKCPSIGTQQAFGRDVCQSQENDSLQTSQSVK